MYLLRYRGSVFLFMFSLVISLTSDANTAPTLPHLRPSEKQVLMAERPVSIIIQPRSGWELNPKAPSWLAVYQQTPQLEGPIQKFNRSDLVVSKLRVKLKPFAKSSTYRLQATLYTCKKGEGALCAVESRDIPIEATDREGTPEQLILDLKS